MTPRVPAQRLGRAATFAFGATVVASTACSGAMDADAGPSGSDAGTMADSGGGDTDAGGDVDA
ncbi:MAG: hypothetical protein KC619_31805, partial [Myxococcales bacterium]|nr:hypothetical protein [Myxococcales bacterium]